MSDKNIVKDLKLALEDIRDLAVDYDDFNTVDGLKSLIDDMAEVANLALAKRCAYCNDPIYWFQEVKSEKNVDYHEGCYRLKQSNTTEE